MTAPPVRPKLDRVLDHIATQLYAGHELALAVRQWHGDRCNVLGCEVDKALSAYYAAVSRREINVVQRGLDRLAADVEA